MINPNFDSLDDFKITTSNYDAEFGSAGGALLQVTTKSGAKQIHGSLFEFLRNSAANAADPFTLQNPPLRWNQFGGSFGAPIRKNRIFVFADYQGRAVALVDRSSPQSQLKLNGTATYPAAAGGVARVCGVSPPIRLLQRQLHPSVAQLDPVLVPQFLVCIRTSHNHPASAAWSDRKRR